MQNGSVKGRVVGADGGRVQPEGGEDVGRVHPATLRPPQAQSLCLWGLLSRGLGVSRVLSERVHAAFSIGQRQCLHRGSSAGPQVGQGHPDVEGRQNLCWVLEGQPVPRQGPAGPCQWRCLRRRLATPQVQRVRSVFPQGRSRVPGVVGGRSPARLRHPEVE